MRVNQQPSQSIKYLFAVSLLAVHLLPVWMVTYFPSQDGPSHIYNAQVFKIYHHHHNFRIRDVYQLNWSPFPNWSGHLLMALLMYVFPPLICEKIILSLCVLGLPLSMLYFLHSIDKRKILFALVGLVYSYHYLLMMGFYNFSLSIPIFFSTLGYWWKHFSKLTFKRLLIFYTLLTLTYFSHFQSFLLLVISISVLASFRSLLWPERWSALIFGRLLTLLRFVGYILPFYVVSLTYYLTKTSGYGKNYRKLAWLNEYFFNLKSLVYFREDHIWIGRLLFGLLFFLFFLTLWQRVKSIAKHFLEQSRFSLQLTDSFFVIFILFTIIYYISPNNIQSGGGWINDRVHIYLVLLLLPFLTVTLHRYLKNIVVVILVGLSLWHLSYTIYDNLALSREISEMTKSVGLIKENKTVVLYLDKPGQKFSESLGEIEYVKPFLHVGSYYCLNNKVALLRNYEAAFDYFPVNYRYQMSSRPYSGPKTSYPRPADYVLAWRMTKQGIDNLERVVLGDSYNCLHVAPRYTLYQLKEPVPNIHWWWNNQSDNRPLIFDFQPDRSVALDDSVVISPISRYENYEHCYGWITEGKLTAAVSNRQFVTPLLADSISGTTKTDGVFRVALPNGRYNVTNFFQTDRRSIRVIANGISQKNQRRTNHDIIEQNYNITITEKQLTQIVYSKGRTWSWYGCRIQPID